MTPEPFSIQYPYFLIQHLFCVYKSSAVSFIYSLLFYSMPNTSSAKKALKQSQTKASRNRRFNALYKETLKAFQKAVASGSSDGLELLGKLYSRIDTLVKKNILHINNGSRKKSRFAKMLKSVSTKA